MKEAPVIFDLTYQRATDPERPEQPGTRALLDYMMERWPSTWSMGIDVNRRIRGSADRWSMHSEGRAVDLGVPLHPEGEHTGNEIAQWLIDHAQHLGIQYFIWNRRSWRKSHGWRPYKGTSPHRDHLHIEQTRAAGEQLTLNMIDALEAPTIPPGPETEPGLHFEDPIVRRPIISWVDCPTGGVWELADNGDIYATGSAPYYGGPNHEVLGREFDMLGEPEHIKLNDEGPGYMVVTDLDYPYRYHP